MKELDRLKISNMKELNHIKATRLHPSTMTTPSIVLKEFDQTNFFTLQQNKIQWTTSIKPLLI